MSADYTRDEILAHVEQVATARGWGSDTLAGVVATLTSLDGWDPLLELDGEPGVEWYPAAAIYLRGTGLQGAAELAALYDQQPAMQAAQDARDWGASPAGVVAGTVAATAEDLGDAAAVVGTAAETVATSRLLPWLIGGAILTTGLALWRLGARR